MSWREMSPMEQRLELIREFESGVFTMTELAAQYGISRKTAYKWLERYTCDGVIALQDRSRRPHRSPQATDTELVERLLAQRRRHPRWGPKKLLAVGQRQKPRAAWPARSTVAALLKRHGLITSPRRAARPAQPTGGGLTVPTGPNEVWTTDFKGEFRTGDGVYCWPLTLRDGFSRFVLRCEALLNRTTELTRPQFARAFAEYGLPARIRSDNGGPFASLGLGRVSRLSVWWMRLGIMPERIVPGHPEQNGSHEQFHRVLKAETARPPAAHCRAQQQRFDRFCREYNEARPHEALSNQTPAACYVPSPRALPTRLPPLEYPGHFEVRRVSSQGYIKWNNEPFFVAEALAEEPLGFEEVDEGLWTMYFGAIALGRLDERQRVITAIAAARR